MAEKETELTYAGLKSLKKNDYVKLFKKPAPWKKAQGVLFLAKYKFDNGKLPLVAVPFKKYSEAAKCFKNEVKKDSIYSAKLSLLASLEKIQDDKGNLVFKVTPMQGSLNAEFLDTYGKELFGTLKVGFEVVGTEGNLDNEDVQEVVEAADETLSTKKTDKIVAKQQKRAAKATKIQENLDKFEKAIGKIEAPKLQEKLTLYNQVLAEILAEATEDGKVDTNEQKELKRMQQNIERMVELVTDVEKATTLAGNIQNILKNLQTA